MILNYLIVGCGGAIGSILRYGIGILSVRLWGLNFPWGTMAINVIGALLIGIFAGLLSSFQNWAETTRLFFMVGILGGFTTFSTFSLDAVMLIEREQYLYFILYTAGSVILSIAVTIIGLFLTRVVTG